MRLPQKIELSTNLTWRINYIECCVPLFQTSMGYSVLKREILQDESVVEVVNHFSMYIASVYKYGEYCWRYEAESYQAVMVWVNKVKKEPLPYKEYESGTFCLPHNNGFGNTSGKREVVFS